MECKDTGMLGLSIVGALADVVRLPLEGVLRPGLDDILADGSVDVGDIGALLNPCIGRIGHNKVVGKSKSESTLGVA